MTRTTENYVNVKLRCDGVEPRDMNSWFRLIDEFDKDFTWITRPLIRRQRGDSGEEPIYFDVLLGIGTTAASSVPKWIENCKLLRTGRKSGQTNSRLLLLIWAAPKEANHEPGL